MAMRERHRSGFTLIEVLVVVLIIVILLSLLMPALTMLKSKQKRAATLGLIRDVTQAMTKYMVDYPVLGNDADSDDFAETPYLFLYHNYKVDLRKEPCIDLAVKMLAKGSGTYTAVARPEEAEHILDHFMTGDRSNQLIFEITNEEVPLVVPKRYATVKVRIISKAGTTSDSSDDLIYEYTKESGQWDHKKP